MLVIEKLEFHWSFELGHWSLPNRVRRSLLECSPNRAVVGVFEVRPLHHEDVRDALDRIGPRLGAVGSAVAEGAGREHRGHTFGLFYDASGTSPVVPARDKAGFQIAG